jgi:uncharacterized RDD family membrane protein YckC
MGETGSFEPDQGGGTQGAGPRQGAVPPPSQPGTWPRPPDAPAAAQGPRHPYAPPPHAAAYPPQHGYPPGYAAGYPPPHARYPQPVWRPPAPLAEWWQRLVASLVDGALMFLVQLPGLVLVYGPIVSAWLAAVRAIINGQQPPPPAVSAWWFFASLVGVAYLLLGTAAGAWYFGWRQGLTGQTFGKRMMRIRLVGMYGGQPIGGKRGLGRYGLRLLIAMGYASIVSFLWPLWDAKRQTWEDMALKSIVVRDDQPA